MRCTAFLAAPGILDRTSSENVVEAGTTFAAPGFVLIWPTVPTPCGSYKRASSGIFAMTLAAATKGSFRIVMGVVPA
ncbi:hypothetical protein SDC9_182415 [bioreactor metagenome]|uniref:Uncharacterized protein n=1 Tax=bioreactor metagenome TaxID=1076179 RepID=A0A645H7B8_9ZZZZ